MMNNYPLYIQPERFKRIKEELPPLPPPPSKPKLIKKNWLEKLILWEDEFEDQEINARRLLKYQEKLIRYQQEVNKILSETEVEIYRNKQKINLLSRTQHATTLNRDVKRGRCESLFEKVLTNYFGDKIHTNIEFTLDNGNGFVPDFAYIDNKTGLCIDIEIDEPYSLPDKQPIHCIGEDEYRNKFFTDRGWFVIRFAEEQIAKQSNDCCDFIGQAIQNIMNGKKMEDSVIHISRWTYNEAKNLAAINYRESY